MNKILSISLLLAATSAGAHYHTVVVEETPVVVAPAPVVIAPAPAVVVAQPAPVVMVETAPPAEVEEVMTACPGSNYVWIKGYWRWDGCRYVREHGRWCARPHANAVWVEGCWTEHHHRWHYTEGCWR